MAGRSLRPLRAPPRAIISRSITSIACPWVPICRGLLASAEDPRGNTTEYTYEADSDKLTKVEVKSGGAVKGAVEYGYVKDQLDTITHNGFDYSFTYDTFGNPLSTKVAGQTLSTNIYGPRNGFLERMNYGNGAYIEYLYDSLYRVNSTWLNGIQQTRLLYDSQGDLYRWGRGRYCQSFERELTQAQSQLALNMNKTLPSRAASEFSPNFFW